MVRGEGVDRASWPTLYAAGAILLGVVQTILLNLFFAALARKLLP